MGEPLPVIPTFNYLNGFNLNFGIIILILTILVRIILLPLTYGSFKSQAKIRVLQPEMLELNEKYGDDPMKKQQETMNLYRRAGVNPLGGCIPGLLQLPILIAMFRFFPPRSNCGRKVSCGRTICRPTTPSLTSASRSLLRRSRLALHAADDHLYDHLYEDEYADDRSDESVDEMDDVPDADFLPQVLQ